MLIVDAANVMGSRPDGWWRDRPGALRRLHGQISDAVSSGHLDAPVLIVAEGAARRGVAEGRIGAVEMVHAPGSGDDAIVALVTRRSEANAPSSVTGDTDVTGGIGDTVVTVVTADRDLRERVHCAGGSSVGPRWLLDRLGRPA